MAGGTSSEAPAPRAGMLRGLGLALICCAASALVLSGWNVLHVVTGARAYRDDPGRAAELLALSTLAYAGILVLPLLAASLAVTFLLGRRGGDRDDATAWHVAAAGAAAALLVGVGILTPRAPRVFLGTAPSLLDASLAALAAAAAAVAVHRLTLAVLRSRGAATLARLCLGLFWGLAVSLVGWVTVRDHMRVGARSPAAVVVAVVTLVVGLLSGLGLSEGIRYLGRLPGRAGRRRGARGIGAAALAAFVGLSLLAAGAPPGTSPAAEGEEPPRPNVLVIVADTLRADHVGCYGAARVRTPSIDGLAARGARMETAYASASWTNPATASLMTGLHPSSHGMTTYRDRIRSDAVTLASAFKAAGYATAGFTANPVLSARFGFAAGFDVWEEDLNPGRLDRHRSSPLYATLTSVGLWSPPEIFPRGEEVVRRAGRWLDRAPRRPFFLYAHFMDPHDPYAPPPPYDSMYGDPEGSRLRMRFGTLPAIMQGSLRVGPADLDRLLALYDGAISYMDGQIGRLLDLIERRGETSRTLVVFAADHGEEFNDHGGLGHEHTLYEELVRIPLVVAGPGVRPGRLVREPVRQIDVAPTIAAAAGVPLPGALDGVSVWDAISGGEEVPARDVFMEETYIGIRAPHHALRALRRGDLKLVGGTFHVRGRGPWRWELYDLAADPAERRNLASARPADVEALAARIEAWAARPRVHRPERAPQDEEMEQRLRALGYVQ